MRYVNPSLGLRSLISWFGYAALDWCVPVDKAPRWLTHTPQRGYEWFIQRYQSLRRAEVHKGSKLLVYESQYGVGSPGNVHNLFLWTERRRHITTPRSLILPTLFRMELFKIYSYTEVFKPLLKETTTHLRTLSSMAFILRHLMMLLRERAVGNSG